MNRRHSDIEPVTAFLESVRREMDSALNMPGYIPNLERMWDEWLEGPQLHVECGVILECHRR